MERIPVATVVIPCRNEEHSIAAAIDAVAAQDHPLDRLEVVVVDGASSDRTQQAAKDALDRHAFARSAVLANPVASTPSNLNLGLGWAEGEVLVRVDARSRPPADYVSTLATLLMERPDIAVCGGSQVARPRSESPRDVAIARALNNRVAMGGARYRRAGAASGETDTAYLGVFRTEQLRQVGGWNVDFPTNQDFELNRRMATHGTVWFEAGLPVGYVPRAKVSELVTQYRRFGGWKVRYWGLGHRPQPRQVALLAAPVGAVGCAGLVVAKGGLGGAAALLGAALAGGVAVDALGGAGPAGPAVRVRAGAINLAIGAAWFGGVTEGTVRNATRRLARRCGFAPRWRPATR